MKVRNITGQSSEKCQLMTGVELWERSQPKASDWNGLKERPEKTTPEETVKESVPR